MIVLGNSLRQAPENWELRWGIAPTVAVLIATARDNAEPLEQVGAQSPPKGTVLVLSEIALKDFQLAFDRTERLLVLRERMKMAMKGLSIAPENIADTVIERDVNRNPGPLDWGALSKLFLNAGLRLSIARAPMRIQSLRVLSNPRAGYEAPKLYVTPECGKLIELQGADLVSIARSQDTLRALCHALEI